MAELLIERRGTVSYLAGYCQDRHQIGRRPVYRSSRVVQVGGLAYYCPDGALVQTADGWCELPADLVAKVVWDAAPARGTTP